VREKNVAKSKQSSKHKQSAKSSMKGNQKKPVNKHRGGLLSFLIILIGVHAVSASILIYSYLKQDYLGQRTWILVALLLASLADIAAAIGLWLWKQWGLYLYIIATAVLAAVSILVTGNVWVSLYQFIPVAIFGYIISLQNKQKLFT
jgi:cytochrome bd-type quinol oxidase subunit 1